mmetsp:Transcript_11039/g.21102  ORF Transcript_11039/g.21102 Transcript_11039/m.21102 type:complete len:325 (-) Transcript_11039:499-1473(-)
MTLLKLTLLLLQLPFFVQAVRDSSRATSGNMGDFGVPRHWLGAFRGEDGSEQVVGVARGSQKTKLLFANLMCDEPRTTVALKILTTGDWRSGGTFPSAARSEATIMQMLEPHPKLVQFFALALGDMNNVKGANRKLQDLNDFDDKVVFAVEYVPGGHLSFDKIKALTLPTRLRLFRDIVAGTAAMHRQGIRHGDLKPEQIFLTVEDCEDPLCRAKVGDFGTSCLVNEAGDAEERTTTCGASTPEFRAPESCLFNETTWQELHPPTLQNDHWSLGAILYEVVVKSALIVTPDWMRWKDFTQESQAASENTVNISNRVAGRKSQSR